MPGVLYPADDYLFQQIVGLENQLAALAQQGHGLPPVSAFHAGALSTSSGVPLPIAGGPSVSAIIGYSGDALVYMASLIDNGTSGGTATVSLAIDGTTYGGAGLTNAGAGNQIIATASATIQLSAIHVQLSQGFHVFSYAYASGLGTANFYDTSLTVQPL